MTVLAPARSTTLATDLDDVKIDFNSASLTSSRS